jgi:hypothetical protein
MLVGGDNFTQNVVEEEIGQMRKEGIVGEESIRNIRGDTFEGVVVRSEHSEGTGGVEGSIKSSALYSSLKGRQRRSSDNKVEEGRLGGGRRELSTAKMSLGFLK